MSTLAPRTRAMSNPAELAEPAEPAARQSTLRVITAISIGNALEWFEIVIYGFLAVTIAKLFFPAENESVSLLITLGTFGVTFVMRPVGSLVLGAYADAKGRKNALTLSMAIMLCGTLLIAVSPTFSQIGLWAPGLVILARLLQGFAAGGEFGSATALLAEQDPRRRGFFASWQFASQGITTFLAAGFGMGLNALLTPEQLLAWGWRIPFFFGLLIGPAGLYIRRHLDEGLEFKRAAQEASPVRTTLVDQRGRTLAAMGLIILATVVAYTGLFMPTFAVRQLGLPASMAFAGTFWFGVLQFALVPMFGSLSDRVGRVVVMRNAALAMGVMIVPLFYLLVNHPSVPALMLALTAMGVVASAYWGPISAAMSELFPAATRGTGLSVSYSFGVAIFGGFAPFISAWLITATGSKIAPSFYVAFGVLVSLVALRAARRYGVK
ncbi:MFS transporter, MHS family, proline/betaine transporter [Variovorax sp. OK605]|nr:MFS transporter, MHS family, proline/betaine transporter [Variovorax sp. OK202]SFD06659.1 MFS transporter, MHS family, proline/betaine transporter [Variovorax sp. OK212]SFP11504.1 MFS transporter, MHS family, proline/betaine transporter [Variovorax sp. OK605]